MEIIVFLSIVIAVVAVLTSIVLVRRVKIHEVGLWFFFEICQSEILVSRI